MAAIVQWRTSEFEIESTGKCTRHEFVGGSGSTAPFIRNLGIRWSLAVRLRSQPLNSRGKGPRTDWIGWASKPVGTRCRREKWLAFAGIRTPDRQARNLVTLSTAPSRLLQNLRKWRNFRRTFVNRRGTPGKERLLLLILVVVVTTNNNDDDDNNKR